MKPKKSGYRTGNCCFLLYAVHFTASLNLMILSLSLDKVIPLGRNENFWEMGEIGPCGICTEIHFLAKPSSSHHNLLSNCLEIWNIVFIQYEM